MPIGCQVVFQNGSKGNFDFEEIPRMGDFIQLPRGPGLAPVQLQVNRVVFAAVGSIQPPNVEIFVS